MSTLVDPWHFPRPQLAAAYLQAFDMGLVSARGIFARRRMGKTEFLKQDLLPAATEAGYLTAYTNLWDDMDHPGQAIANAVLAAVQQKGLARFWQDLSTPVRKLKAGGKLPTGVEASVELDLAEREKLAVPAIQTALTVADKSKKRLLLVLDEAQVLAAAPHDALAHSLRAGLDIRKTSIKVLFAGSSESALRQMFSKASAPFYNWAPIETFPLLGEEFVDATVAHVRRLAKRPLSSTDARTAFGTLKETPEFFRWYIERYMLYQDQGHQAALDDTLERISDDSGFSKIWSSAPRADRAVLMLAASGVSDLYSAGALKQLKELLGAPDVTVTVPRTSLRRLTGTKQQLLARLEHGAYRFEDQEFEAWVRARRGLD